MPITPFHRLPYWRLFIKSFRTLPYHRCLYMHLAPPRSIWLVSWTIPFARLHYYTFPVPATLTPLPAPPHLPRTPAPPCPLLHTLPTFALHAVHCAFCATIGLTCSLGWTVPHNTPSILCHPDLAPDIVAICALPTGTCLLVKHYYAIVTNATGNIAFAPLYHQY